MRRMAVKVFKYINSYLETMGARRCLFITLMGSLLLGVLDYLMGPELSFSVFYTVPIMIAGWYGGRAVGLTIAVISAGIWLSADLAAGSHYASLLVPIWNTLVRLAFFLIILCNYRVNSTIKGGQKNAIYHNNIILSI